MSTVFSHYWVSYAHFGAPAPLVLEGGGLPEPAGLMALPVPSAKCTWVTVFRWFYVPDVHFVARPVRNVHSVKPEAEAHAG